MVEETFLQQARTSDHRLPLHISKEMRAYLECGVSAYGFVRARCDQCGTSRAVTFVQRFGSSLNVNPHVHIPMLDGIYVDGAAGPQFRCLTRRAA